MILYNITYTVLQTSKMIFVSLDEIDSIFPRMFLPKPDYTDHPILPPDETAPMTGFTTLLVFQFFAEIYSQADSNMKKSILPETPCAMRLRLSYGEKANGFRSFWVSWIISINLQYEFSFFIEIVSIHKLSRTILIEKTFYLSACRPPFFLRRKFISESSSGGKYPWKPNFSPLIPYRWSRWRDYQFGFWL